MTNIAIIIVAPPRFPKIIEKMVFTSVVENKKNFVKRDIVYIVGNCKVQMFNKVERL